MIESKIRRNLPSSIPTDISNEDNNNNLSIDSHQDSSVNTCSSGISTSIKRRPGSSDIIKNQSTTATANVKQLCKGEGKKINTSQQLHSETYYLSKLNPLQRSSEKIELGVNIHTPDSNSIGCVAQKQKQIACLVKPIFRDKRSKTQ